MEDLAAFGSSDDDEAQKSISRIREMTPDETDASKDAESLLSMLTRRSELLEVMSSADDFFDLVQRAEAQGARTDPRSMTEVARVQRGFKTWLSSFRAFDDRTAAWLSKTFGPDDAALATFKSLLSEEFDANFAYRLAAGLRNAAEHQASVINKLSINSREIDRESGETVHELMLQFDAPALAETFTRVRSATRKEWEGVEQPIEVEHVIDAVMQSVHRAHAGLLLALWPRIREAVNLIEGWHREAVEAGGQAGMFVDQEGFPLPQDERGNLRFRWNSHQAARMIRRNVAEAAAIHIGPAPQIGWPDLVESPDSADDGQS